MRFLLSRSSSNSNNNLRLIWFIYWMRNATDLHEKNCNRESRNGTNDRRVETERMREAEHCSDEWNSHSILCCYHTHWCNSKRTRFICTFLSGNVLSACMKKGKTKLAMDIKLKQKYMKKRAAWYESAHRTKMFDIILNECEFTIAMCFWNFYYWLRWQRAREMHASHGNANNTNNQG